MGRMTEQADKVNNPAASSGVLTLAAVAKYPHECGYLACCTREQNKRSYPIRIIFRRN